MDRTTLGLAIVGLICCGIPAVLSAIAIYYYNKKK